MNHDELDRILSEPDGLEPSSGLTSRVMHAVEQERDAPEPVPFPWLRLVPALLGALCIAGAFVYALATQPAISAPTPNFDVALWLENPTVMAFGLLSVSLLGSWIAVRLSMRATATF